MPAPRNATAPAASAAPLTLADLRRALDHKERELRVLLERRNQLAEELAELGTTLEAMLEGGSVAPGRRTAATAKAPKLAQKAAAATAAKGKRSAPRAKVSREGGLTTFIRAVLERVVGPLRVAEIVDAVQKAGYASKSSNLNIIVSNRIAQMDDVEKVERGLYQLRRDGSTKTEAAEAAKAAAGS